MRFAGSSVLPLLAERGADVDEATGLVRLPRELVEWAVGQCPRRIVMAGLDGGGRRACWTRASPSTSRPAAASRRRSTSAAGERRASTLQDVRECTALNDELPELDIMWTQVSASDVPLEARELTEYFTLLTETRKHVTFVDCPTEVDAVVRLCEALAGDLERFRARPRISTVVTAASPLQVDGGILDVHVALARHGVPVKIYSMAIAGATAPVTLAGTVVQGLAEFLGVATALQVAAPGRAPRLLLRLGRARHAPDDVRAGLRGGALMAAMATEVGHHVGVPTLSPGFSTDARHVALQDGYEKAMKAATVCAANPDVVTGWGLVDSHNTMSLPQSVIDNEMAGMLQAAEPAGRGLRRHARRRGLRRRRAGRRVPRPQGDGQAHPRRRALPADPLEPALLREVGGAGRDGVRRGLRARGGAAGRARLKEPYIDGALLDEIAAICRVDDDAVRRARREVTWGGLHDAQDRLHRARRPRQAPGREPAARRLPAHRVRRGRELRRRARQGGRRLRRLDRGDRARLRHHHHLPAVARGGGLRGRRGGRRARGARPRRHLDRHEHQRRARAAAPLPARRRQRHRDARGAGHRRRAPRRRRHDHRARRRQAGGVREAPPGLRRHGRARLLHRRAGPGLGDQGHHQHAGLHPPRRRRRGAHARQEGRHRPQAGLGRHQGELGQQLRARDRGPARS